MKQIFVVLILLSLVSCSENKTRKPNVILITLDGMRWQEVFTGAEARLITSGSVRDSVTTAKEFLSDTDEKRRERLMPFLWSTISEKGQIYGNRKFKNFVNVTNQQWFSYPGYNELLCGFADDERITSNDKFENPNKTVLEFVNDQPDFKGKVAAYTSWDVFEFIINASRSGIPVSAGIKEAIQPNEKEKILNEIMYEVPNPLGDVRLDAFTFHYGFEYLKKNKPNLFYFSFDETDDFAHAGRYDLYLHSAQNTDGFIRKLWEWCQSDPQYKDNTTLIITVDHGRGNAEPNDWHSHNRKMPGSDEIWMAVVGPQTPPLGEVKSEGQLYQNQIAKTIATLLGVDYKNGKEAGKAIEAVTGK